MDLVLVVALCEVYELEIERLLRQFGNLVLAFVLPYGGVYEVFVVTVGLAFGRLVLDTEVIQGISGLVIAGALYPGLERLL